MATEKVKTDPDGGSNASIGEIGVGKLTAADLTNVASGECILKESACMGLDPVPALVPPENTNVIARGESEKSGHIFEDDGLPSTIRRTSKDGRLLRCTNGTFVMALAPYISGKVSANTYG